MLISSLCFSKMNPESKPVFTCVEALPSPLSVLEEMIKQQKSEVEKAKQIQEEKRLVLQEAMQERKTQERLYENAFAEFIQEENAKEGREIDELTSYKYGRKSREEVKHG